MLNPLFEIEVTPRALLRRTRQLLTTSCFYPKPTNKLQHCLKSFYTPSLYNSYTSNWSTSSLRRM
ncbi:hypothetical protein M6B38_202910 [Iris pallida]|uniref:Uncharacterized protein n=1 Tax=Iris pallida TaxID=29817 RepID=A0AAX6E875_IRIPA|nr:hypothetical protein M6B38_202910 [Iris pallida]